MRWALIDDDRIVNVIVWDGVEPYDPGALEILELEEGSPLGIGWTRDGDEWIAPPEPEPEDDTDSGESS